MKEKVVLTFFILTISLIYGLPHLVFASFLGDLYQPLVISKISPTVRDEAFAYAPFVKFITNGNLVLKDAYVAEYANYATPFTGETVPAIIFALISFTSGGIDRAFIVGDFLFPALTFLLLYLLTKPLIKNTLFAASACALAVIARDFIAVIPYPDETLRYLLVSENKNHFLYLSRAFHPQITLVLFLSAILFLRHVLSNPKSVKFQIILGITTGLLFYSYIFHWTYFISILGLTFAYLVVKRDLPALRAVVTSSIIAIAIGSYYFYSIFTFYGYSFAQDFIDKSALHGLPMPLTIYRYLVIALLFALVFKFKNHYYFLLFAVLICGVLTPLVSRFIIGQDLETFHYLRRALMPVATVAVFIILYKFVTSKLALAVISCIVIAFALTVGIHTQLLSTANTINEHKKDIDQQAVFTWLTQNTPAGSVVGSLDTDFNSLLPVYTNNKVYFPPTDRTIMPTDEGVERFSILANLLGTEISVQKKYLEKELSYIFVFQAYAKGKGIDLNSPKKQQAEKRIENLADGDWKKLAHNYKLDYLVATKADLSYLNLHKQFLSSITSISHYIIFKVNLDEK